MREQIKNIISEAGQQIAFNCFRKVSGQMDVVKVDAIAEKYAEQVEVAAAPCKNKVEELEYKLRESYDNIDSLKKDLSCREEELKKINGLILKRVDYDLTRSKFGKILDILWE